MKRCLIELTAAGLLLLPACTHTVKVEPVEVNVKPIHATVDINLRMEKAVEDFFDYRDDAEEADDAATKGGGK